MKDKDDSKSNRRNELKWCPCNNHKIRKKPVYGKWSCRERIPIGILLCSFCVKNCPQNCTKEGCLTMGVKS